MAPASIQDRIRIALITETWPPEINGVAMTLQRLVHGLQTRHGDDTVQVVRPAQARTDRALEETHILRLGIPLPGYAGLLLGLPSRHALIARWRAQPPDVVHIATEGPLGWSALLAAENLAIPVTSSFHTNFHTYFRHYHLGLLTTAALTYLRRFHNRCACTMVPTAAQAEELTKAGFLNTRVLSRGVDTGLFHPARRDQDLRRSWGLGERDLAVIHVGRLAAEKNLDLLHRAFAALRRKRPEARLILVGDGPQRAAAASCEGCLAVGVQRGEALARHYASADCFLFPSLTETYGNVLTEALASGLACVTFDYAAGREVVRDGRNGLLAATDDEAGFIAQAERLGDDPGLVARLRRAASAAIAGRSWPAVSDQFRRLLLEAVSRGRRRQAG